MGPRPGFTAKAESSNGIARICLAGELDMWTAPVVTEELARFDQDGVIGIMLDLRDLTFIDSGGLHALLQAWDRSKTNGHRLILVGASGSARRLFELTGTQFLLDDQEAVTLLDQFTGSKARRAASLSGDGDA